MLSVMLLALSNEPKRTKKKKKTESKFTEPLKEHHCQIWMVGIRCSHLGVSVNWPSITSLVLIVAEKWV